MKGLTTKIIRWIFYLPLSLIGGTIAGVICQWIMPYMAIGVLWFCGVDYHRGPVLFDFENTIYDVKISIVQYIVLATSIIISIVVFGIVAGWIAGKVCPAKNPHIGATTITVLLFICCAFSTFRIWDTDRLFVCITSIIGYVIALILSYTTAFNIKNEES